MKCNANDFYFGFQGTFKTLIVNISKNIIKHNNILSLVIEKHTKGFKDPKLQNKEKAKN